MVSSVLSVVSVSRVRLCLMAMLIDLVASNVAPVVLVAETGALNVSAVR